MEVAGHDLADGPDRVRKLLLADVHQEVSAWTRRREQEELTGETLAEGKEGLLGDVREQPKVADAASELLRDVFGKEKNPCRLVYGVASLPLGTPVELEVIFEVAG